MSKESEFQKKIKTLMEEAGQLEDKKVKTVLKMLNNARKEIAAEVASTDWDIFHQRQLTESVERAMVDFGEQYGIDIRSSQKEFWDLGIVRADLPLEVMEIAIPDLMINIKALEIAQGYSADLVGGLAKDAAKKINREIISGIMGQKTPFEVMKAIGRNLNDPSVFSSIATRGETITRTEMGRIFEMSTQVRLEEYKEAVPNLKKKWQSSPMRPTARPEHHTAEVDGQIREIDEPFDVGGEQLMYPGDPAGSAENTINCG
jgi:hypothetical protein